MASNAAELASYSAVELVGLLRTTHRRADFDAVALVLSARERGADQAEAPLKATLADALRKVQAHEDLHRASLAEAEDSARLKRIAEEEARTVLMAAVSEIHEAGKKKHDEVSAHLDAVMVEIYELRKKQQEEFSDSVARIVEETEAKLKASFAKIHAPLKKPERDAASQGTPDDTALALASPSIIEVAQVSKQRVVEMVMVNKGGGAAAAADDSGDKSLKRKADALENRSVSPVQISGGSDERMVDIGVPPGFSPTPQFRSSSWIFEKAGPSSYTSLSQAIEVSAKVSKEVASVQGSGKTVTSMSLFTVPVQLVERFDRATASKRGRGRGSTAAKEKAKIKNVSRGGGSLGRGRGRGRSSNDTSGSLLLGPYSLMNRPSPVAAARPPTVQKYSSGTENASQSRNDDPFLPSNASARGKAEMNIASSSSGHATAGTRGFVPIMPRSSPLRISTISAAEILSICMGSKVTENLGKCVENKTDSVPVMDNAAAEGTSHEEGDVGTSSNDTRGAFPRA